MIPGWAIVEAFIAVEKKQRQEREKLIAEAVKEKKEAEAKGQIQ